MRVSKPLIYSFTLTAFGSFSQVHANDNACEMSHSFTHNGSHTKILSASKGTPSLYYRTKMNVNTDGASRSYHPDDPNGSNIAYNNMANAITAAWNASGQRITCDGGKAENRKGKCYAEFIQSFEGARDVDYNPGKYPRVETGSIIPWLKTGSIDWPRPCQIAEGTNKGFFVSQTSLRLSAGSTCDPSIYVDSLSINAVVHPRLTKWSSQGIVTDGGDLVVLRNRNNGKIAYAIHGDRGPEGKLGEGSIALTSNLSGTPVLSTDSYKEIKKLSLASVDYLVFPASDVVRHFGKTETITQDKIDQYGTEIFEQWGGVARLNACASL
ncbi:glycoside hydrolase family 75 protein [Pseudomonas sp. Marseille-P9899]|uniref:glycoside hydrolase family 75 protein n=1 Tax=Pseudomonas sp. Marseille-P9899 TaxID=2730401 RepID=UPI00158F4ECA|nr:glycoside hydrolase family 75 protein [Pseudomonas sp. Marseille-P9899]